MTGTAGQSRVFFALWPTPELRARVHRETQRLHGLLDGRPTHPDSLHLTLVFVGGVDNRLLPALAEAASQVRCAPFEMRFDRVDCWRHNRIAHLGATQPPPALFDLVERLSSHLKAAGIGFDERAYTPHITLIRKADCSRMERNEKPALEPIRWLARDFVLVRSSLRPDGARYEQLGRWPLP